MKAGAGIEDLAAAFEVSPNPYMLLTPDLRYAGVNKAYLAAMDRRREDLIGAHVFEAFDGGPGPDAPRSVQQLKASFEKVLATGEADHLAVIHYSIPLSDDQGRTRHEDRYWSCVHAPVKDAEGRLLYILQYATDITELHRLRLQAANDREETGISALDAIVGGDLFARAERVQEDNRRLEVERSRLVEMFMQAPGFVAVLSGPDHVVQMHNDAYAALIGRGDIAGKSTREAMPDIAGQGYYELLDSVFATGEPFEGRGSHVTFSPSPGGEPQDTYVDFIYQPIRGANREVVGIFVQGYDVTATVKAAQRQKLLIDELNHRVKNTLATVQSIAIQTARSHTDPTTFAESFQARLLALSHTHDLLTRSHWEGADLREILRHETEAHGAHRVTLNGPPVALEPAAALSLGMIFHELATNAAKYGALSIAEGRVLVDWSISNQASRRLTLDWREMDGPPVREPERRGFGGRLIERNIRHDLAGEFKLSYPSIGFRAEMSVPLDRGQGI